MSKEEIKFDLENLIEEKECKIYGDSIIGYRAQDDTGRFLDNEVEEIFERYAVDGICEGFNEACFDLRSGDYNW